MPHSPRFLPDIVPAAYRAISGVEAYIRGCGLDKSLVELVKLRASQINALRLLHRYAHQRRPSAW